MESGLCYLRTKLIEVKFMVQRNDLTPEEVEALRDIVFHSSTQRVMPPHIRDHLIQLGYIEQKLGGLAATGKGKMHPALHK